MARKSGGKGHSTGNQLDILQLLSIEFNGFVYGSILLDKHMTFIFSKPILGQVACLAPLVGILPEWSEGELTLQESLELIATYSMFSSHILLKQIRLVESCLPALF